MPVILPDDASPGEPGHVNDHNVIRDAVAELQSQIASALVEADIVAGTNVTITPGAGNSITISASGGGAAYDDTAVLADIAALEAADTAIQTDLDLAETTILNHEERLTLLESSEQGGGYSVSNWYEAHLESFLTPDSTYYSIATRKEGSNVVRLRGRASATTWASGDTLFTIVRDHRPARPVSVLAMVTDTIDPVRLLIGTDGTVKAQSAMTNPAFLCVDSVEFSSADDVVIPDSVIPPPVEGGTIEVIGFDTTDSGASTASTQSFTLPSGLTTSDIGYICIVFNQRDDLNFTSPAGWTQHPSSPVEVNSTHVMRIWSKNLSASDSAVSWNCVGSARFLGHVVVVRNGASTNTAASWSGNTSGTSITVPSITATEADTLEIAFVNSKIAAGAGAGWTSSTPSGWTELASSDVFTPSTDTQAYQQAVLIRDTSPTNGVATGTSTASTSITTASRGSVAIAVSKLASAPPPATWTMYWGSSVDGGNPADFENGTGLFVGTGLGGAKLPAYRSYENINSRSGTLTQTSLAERNAVDSRINNDHANARLPLISFKAPGNDWAGVAAGTYDTTWLDPLLSIMAGRAYPVYAAFHHEPRGDGTPANWVAMQKHVRQRLDLLENGSNVKIVGILNGYSFDINEQDLYYHAPGTGVHFMGLDSYNPWYSGGTKKWLTVEEVFSPLYTLKDWGYDHGVIGEWGVRDHPTENDAQWVLDAYQYCLAAEAEAVCYFNSGQNSPEGTWQLTVPRLTSWITGLNAATTRRITD